MILNSIEDIIRRVNAQAPIINLPTENISLDLLLDTSRISPEDLEKMKHTEDEHTHSQSI